MASFVHRKERKDHFTVTEDPTSCLGYPECEATVEQGVG